MASVPEYHMPRLYAIRGQRIQCIDFYEPEEEDKIPYDTMKNLTGGDKINYSLNSDFYKTATNDYKK
jgi:hypothetical protein